MLVLWNSAIDAMARETTPPSLAIVGKSLLSTIDQFDADLRQVEPLLNRVHRPGLAEIGLRSRRCYARILWVIGAELVMRLQEFPGNGRAGKTPIVNAGFDEKRIWVACRRFEPVDIDVQKLGLLLLAEVDDARPARSLDSGRANEQLEATQVPPLDPDDLRILQVMAQHPATIKQIDLEQQKDDRGEWLPSRRTLSSKLRRLRSAGLVHRPFGDRKGEAITLKGLEVVRQLAH